MNDLTSNAPAVFAGVLLGALFFGGLWWTVHKALASAHPARLFVASILLRSGIVLAGFYWVSAGEWKGLVACLVGFIAARVLILRIIRRLSCKPLRPLEPQSLKPLPLENEHVHAA